MGPTAAAQRRRSRSDFEQDETANAARKEAPGCVWSSDQPDSKRMRLRGGRGPKPLVSDDDSSSEEDDSEQASKSKPDMMDESEDSDGDEANDTDTSRTVGYARHANDKAMRYVDPETGFAPGAIVRVRLTNFVTYKSAEFIPGPNLNMVIGPNGTGKSSLVCAICLGLGYPPSVLGRAATYGEFVKHGEDTAEIEIELQKKPDAAKNYTIRLQINRETNSRKFWWNDLKFSHEQVQGWIRDDLRIQVDNLCQFLPQDKVAEFSGLDSVNLLTKTLEATASRGMNKTRLELRKKYDLQKSHNAEIENDVEVLRGLELRQQGLQADVERLRDRSQIQSTIKDLEEAKICLAYEEAKTTFRVCNRKRKNAEEERKRLQKESGPSLQAVEKKTEYHSDIQKAVESRRSILAAAKRTADTKLRALDAAHDELQTMENRKAAEHESLKTQRKDIYLSRKNLTKLQGQVGQEREFNPSEWNRKIREQEHVERETEAEIHDIERTQIQRIKRLGIDTKNKLAQIDTNLQALESQQGQRLSQLRRFSRDAATGWEWLQEHGPSFGFEHEVFGPPMLSCSIKDKRYSDQIQSMLQQDDFLCFITQSKNDHRKLSDQFYRTMSLSVSIRSVLKTFDQFPPPMSKAQLQSHGLDGFALDFLQGPEPVLASLCTEKRLHASAVGLANGTEEQFDRILSGDIINSWVAGDTSFKITRRRDLGPGAVATTSKTVQPGRFWSDQPADDDERRQLVREQKETLAQYEELKADNAKWREKKVALESSLVEIKEKADTLRASKNELQKEYHIWKAIPKQIAQEQTALEEKLKLLANSKQNIQDLVGRLERKGMDRAQLVLDLVVQNDAIRDACQALQEALVQQLEAESDIDCLKDRNREILAGLEEEQRKVNELVKEAERLKRIAVQAQHAVEDMNRQYLDDVNRSRILFLSELGEGKTVETISEDISAEKAKLELIHAADPGVLEDFENRAQQITALTAKRDGRQQRLDDLNVEIKALRERWEPKLDAIIERINTAFGDNFLQINCAGEVGVHKDEDFAKWAIEIKVKFRPNETLQRLDQHRQSGGERAVSTIFYLMSLQSMAQAPFRVVDEINQGMDPRNERMVHERMVEIACRGATSSQYFLITPKLLPGLQYDEKIKVLCIASGAYMPPVAGLGVGASKARDGRRPRNGGMVGEDEEDAMERDHAEAGLDFARLVEIKRQLLAAAA